MSKLTSPGQLNNEYATRVYNIQREIVDALVKSGEILTKNADREWAKRVYADLTEHGLKASKKIIDMLK